MGLTMKEKDGSDGEPFYGLELRDQGLGTGDWGVKAAFWVLLNRTGSVMSHVKILPKGQQNLMLNSYHEWSQQLLTPGGQHRQEHVE